MEDGFRAVQQKDGALNAQLDQRWCAADGVE